jgi:hypothetical protein
MLADKKTWSRDRKAGYLEGEKYRKNRRELSSYLKIGIDEYAQGFRAGYYKRDEQVRVRRDLALSAPPLPQRHRLIVASKNMPKEVSGTFGSRLLLAAPFLSGRRSAYISK